MYPNLFTNKKLVRSLLATTGIAAFGGVAASAGTFQTDFNSGVPPAGSQIYGSATTYNHSTGGVNNSGVLKLTTNVNSHQSTFVIDDIDAGAAIGGFDATWKMRIGGGSGTPADGVSFVFGKFGADLGGADDTTWGEEGPGAGSIEGLTVVFDIYNNGSSEAPAIDLKWNGVEVATRKFPIATLRSGTAFWDVKVHVDTDGTLDLVYNNQIIYTNVPIFQPTAGRFAFGARTGGLNENQFVDDLSITTVPASGPYIRSLSPAGPGAHPEGLVAVQVVDFTTQVNPASIVLKFDDVTVTPIVSKEGDVTTIAYNHPGVLETNSTHSWSLTYADNAPTPNVNTTGASFSVGTFPTIPAEYAVSSVDTTKPGFKTRVYQMPVARTPGDVNTIAAAERAIAGGYIDPATGTTYANTADLTAVGTDGFFVDENVINWSEEAGGIERGSFTTTSTPPSTDEPVPGIPGAPGTDNYVAETWMYLDLKAGAYRFIVNSDDGFRFSTARGVGDVTGQVLGSFNGGKGASDVAFDFAVTQDGFYPFRLLWWEGGGASNLELIMIDTATGQKVLINDATAPVKSYRETTDTSPYVSRVSPEPGQNFNAPDTDITVQITDGATQVNAGSLTVQLDGTDLVGTSSKANGVTTFTRTGSLSTLLAPGAHTGRIIYSITEGGNAVTVTNEWTFSVVQYGVIPVANKVQTGSATGAGFIAKVHQLARTANTTQGDSDRFPGDGNRMPRPEVQLAEGYINTSTGQPFPNVAIPDADADFIFSIPGVLNFNTGLTGTAPNRTLTTGNSGVFGTDEPMPGLGAAGDTERAALSNGGLDNYVAEFTTYLDLKAGSYLFAFNSDDGFIASSAPDVHDTLGTLLGFFNGGRGNANPIPQPTGNPNPTPGANTGNTVFAAVVPADGVYPIRVLYWQGGGGVNAEFFSIDKKSGIQTLVNDTGNGGITAFDTYSGPARAYAKYHVTPTPWDHLQQQAAVAALKFWGRTPNSVDATDIYNWTDTAATTLAIVRPFADTPIGAVFANAAGKTIRMLLNDSEVTPTSTTAGAETTVSYKPSAPLPSGSTNKASLIYEDTTNSWTFTVQNYVEVPATAAKPVSAANAADRGFKAKVVQSTSGRPGGNTVAAAEAHLTGTPANVAIAGPEADGSYIVPGIINWSDRKNTGGTGVDVGNFQDNTLTGWPLPEFADEPIPGIPGTGTTSRDNIAAEITAYLDLPAGYQKFGINGDDGWAVSVATSGQTDGQVLFSINRGAGAADLPFSFTVPQAGLYPIRIVWYEGGGDGNLEFFTYAEDGSKVPVNGADPRAIKAYHKISGGEPAPQLAIEHVGGNVVITWTNGGTLQATTDLSANPVTWVDVSTTGTYTEPPNADAKFFRVVR